MTDRLRVVYHYPGRMRVRAKTFRVLPEVADMVAQRLREEEGVSSVETSEITGSVLVTYDPRVVQMPRLVQLLVRLGGLHGLEVDVGANDPMGAPPGQKLRERLDAWDEAVRRAAGGHVDLRAAVPGMLAAAGASMLLFGRRRTPEWYDLVFWSFVTFVNLNPAARPGAGHDAPRG